MEHIHSNLTLDDLHKPFLGLAKAAGLISDVQQAELLEYQARFLALSSAGVSIQDAVFTARADKNVLDAVKDDWAPMVEELKGRGVNIEAALQDARTRLHAQGASTPAEAPGIGELAVGYRMLGVDIEQGVKVKQALLSAQASVRAIEALNAAKGEAPQNGPVPTPEVVAADVKFSRIGSNPSDSGLLVRAQTNWKDAEVFNAKAHHDPQLLMTETGRMQFAQMRGTAIANFETALFSLQDAGHKAQADGMKQAFYKGVMGGQWQDRVNAPQQGHSFAHHIADHVAQHGQPQTHQQRLLAQYAGPNGTSGQTL